MIINFDTQKISRTLSDFYNATGINMDLLKADFTPIGNLGFWENIRYCKAIQNTAEGKKRCLKSDADLYEKCKISRKPEMHVCHAGLIDIAVPIIYQDTVIGYIIFGQMKTDNDFSSLKSYIKELSLDTKTMEKFYSEIDFFDSGKIESVSNIAEMVVKHILLENMLYPNFDATLEKAVAYITENLDKELSVKKISDNINISKSVLYRRFHLCFSLTVNQFITKKRIEKAENLLKNTDMSIEAISRETGFSSAAHFSKIFKSEKGIPPLKFRKNAVL